MTTRDQIQEVIDRCNNDYLSGCRPPHSTFGKLIMVRGRDIEILVAAAVQAPDIHERVEKALGFKFHPANIAAAIESKINELEKRLAEFEPANDFQI